MSKQEMKWREEFEMLFPIPVPVLRSEHAYVPKTKGIASVKNAEYFNLRYNTFLAAKRQDAERIAELEALSVTNILKAVDEDADHYFRSVAEVVDNLSDIYQKLEEYELGLKEAPHVEELRAKLDALEKQEPACWQQFANGMPTQNTARTYHEKDEITGMLKHLYPGVIVEWEPLYAKPVPATPAIPVKVFNVYHDEAYVGTFYQGSFSTRENAEHYAANNKYGWPAEEMNVEEETVDALLAAAPKPPTNEGEV